MPRARAETNRSFGFLDQALELHEDLRRAINATVGILPVSTLGNDSAWPVLGENPLERSKPEQAGKDDSCCICFQNTAQLHLRPCGHQVHSYASMAQLCVCHGIPRPTHACIGRVCMNPCVYTHACISYALLQLCRSCLKQLRKRTIFTKSEGALHD